MLFYLGMHSLHLGSENWSDMPFFEIITCSYALNVHRIVWRVSKLLTLYNLKSQTLHGDNFV